jgi:hypothetical protein
MTQEFRVQILGHHNDVSFSSKGLCSKGRLAEEVAPHSVMFKCIAAV